MSNRPRFRPDHFTPRLERVVYNPGRVLDLRAGLTPARLMADSGKWARDAGAMVARTPASIEGEPDEALLDLTRTATHDALIDMVDGTGGQRLGPVVWYTFEPRTMADGLVLVADDPALVDALEAHPDWWLLIAMVVALPADRNPHRDGGL